MSKVQIKVNSIQSFNTCFSGENLALSKTALQSSTLWNYEAKLAVDSDPETCSFTAR